VVADPCRSLALCETTPLAPPDGNMPPNCAEGGPGDGDLWRKDRTRSDEIFSVSRVRVESSHDCELGELLSLLANDFLG